MVLNAEERLFVCSSRHEWPDHDERRRVVPDKPLSEIEHSGDQAHSGAKPLKYLQRSGEISH
jgi:hypothetical protein